MTPPLSCPPPKKKQRSGMLDYISKYHFPLWKPICQNVPGWLFKTCQSAMQREFTKLKATCASNAAPKALCYIIFFWGGGNPLC